MNERYPPARLVRRYVFLLVSAAVAVLAAAPAAWAAGPEQTLADRYAPIVALKEHPKPCKGDGERWRPTAVDSLLGNPEVRLRGPLARSRPLKAPTGADLFGKGEAYYLDLPGDPLDPACTFERDAQRFFRGQPAIGYAHIVKEPGVPGRLFLQYWFYYYFNNFNDKHESDWEGIQLSFAARSAREALRAPPIDVGYAQHEGGERANWDSDKLERVARHPVVYVASGSHASHYSSAVWLGRSAGEGWGCDDTTGPSRRLAVQAVVVPTRVTTTAGRFSWLAYEGRWGQRGRAPNDGPTGPNTKDRWIHPLAWQDDLRSGSFQLPVGETLGQSVTGTFCGAVSVAASLLAYFGSPVPVILLPSALLALLGLTALRMKWRPVFTWPLRAQRTTGQILSTSARIYGRHRWLLLGIGAVSIPLGFLAIGFEQLIHWRAVENSLHLPPWTVGLIRVDALHVVVDVIAINATVAIVLDHFDRGRPITLRLAYRLALGKLWALTRTTLVQIVVALVLLLSIIGIPWFFKLLVGGALSVQEVVIDQGAGASARRSSRKLVKGNWWRVAALLFALYIMGVASAPVIGFAFLLFASASPNLVNLIGSLVYALTLPYIGVATTLLYFDLQARKASSAEVAEKSSTAALSITPA